MKKTSMLFMQIFLFISLFALSAKAQAPSPAIQIEEMKKASFLVGEWRGEGWILLGQNQRETFKQSEVVQSKLNGLTMVIEGLGKSTDGKERIVHNALGIVSYDLEKKSYRFSAYQANGQAIDAEAKVNNNALEWGFKTPRGTTRFLITLTDKGEWHEVGDITMDGKNWFKFFEMTLQRVK
jgi:hypothetical protein